LVLGVVSVSEDVGALQGLVEKAEDVVDDEDALLCVLGTGSVWTMLSRYGLNLR
jgi:hypothetical protein